jgi:hypothetical protein
MDNALLQPLLDELDTHQCWIKPIGWSKHPIDPSTNLGRAVERCDFARPSKRLKMDDFLFVYAVGYRQLCFIGRCNTPVQEASTADLEERPDRKRWSYWVNAINKTPTLGRDWARHDIRMFDLVEPHNAEHPTHAFTVGSLNYGSDLLRIPATFAQMVIDQVLSR